MVFHQLAQQHQDIPLGPYIIDVSQPCLNFEQEICAVGKVDKVDKQKLLN